MEQGFEDRIALHERKYRTMVDKFADAVWVVDATSRRYLYISPDIDKLTGYTQERIIGSSIRNSFPPESRERLSDLFKKAKRNYDLGINKSYTAEIESFCENGSTIWLEITAKFVKEQNEPLKIVGISRNIDKRKRMEQKRDSTLEKLKKALEEKEELLKRVKTLESLLPICSGCRRIRAEDNTWWPIEKYVESHTGSQFSHTICPDCKPI